VDPAQRGDPDLASDDGKTALDLATAEGHEEVSNLIRQAAARQ
jgi:ankyrin repeat protein